MSKIMAVFTLTGEDKWVKSKGKFSMDDRAKLAPLDDEAKINLARAQKEIYDIAGWHHADIRLWLRNSKSTIVHENNFDYNFVNEETPPGVCF